MLKGEEGEGGGEENSIYFSCNVISDSIEFEYDIRIFGLFLENSKIHI